jgi:hypothetical protein
MKTTAQHLTWAVADDDGDHAAHRLAVSRGACCDGRQGQPRLPSPRFHSGAA